MDFSGDVGEWQRNVSEGKAGKDRRMKVIEALNIQSGQSIIDIGCGAGHSSIWFSEKVGSVMALDPSSKMIERLENFPKLKTVAGSILSLKMKNEFDGAWASFSLQHLMKKDQKKAYAVVYKILKEKGTSREKCACSVRLGAPGVL